MKFEEVKGDEDSNLVVEEVMVVDEGMVFVDESVVEEVKNEEGKLNDEVIF